MAARTVPVRVERYEAAAGPNGFCRDPAARGDPTARTEADADADATEAAFGIPAAGARVLVATAPWAGGRDPDPWTARAARRIPAARQTPSTVSAARLRPPSGLLECLPLTPDDMFSVRSPACRCCLPADLSRPGLTHGLNPSVVNPLLAGEELIRERTREGGPVTGSAAPSRVRQRRACRARIAGQTTAPTAATDAIRAR